MTVEHLRSRMHVEVRDARCYPGRRARRHRTGHSLPDKLPCGHLSGFSTCGVCGRQGNGRGCRRSAPSPISPWGRVGATGCAGWSPPVLRLRVGELDGADGNGLPVDLDRRLGGRREVVVPGGVCRAATVGGHDDAVGAVREVLEQNGPSQPRAPAPGRQHQDSSPPGPRDAAPGRAIEPDPEPAEPGIEIVLDPGLRLLTDHRAHTHLSASDRGPRMPGTCSTRPAPHHVRVEPATHLLLCCAAQSAATPEPYRRDAIDYL